MSLWIKHYNPFHNPKNGQFTSGHGSSNKSIKKSKYQNSDGTLTRKGMKKYESIVKVSDDLYLAKNKKRGFAKVLGKNNEKIASEQKKYRDYDVLSNIKKNRRFVII